MEEVNLVIAVDVPYEVEITATGIPMHEAKVEFCIPKNEISFNFPAKMITDNKFIFTLTDDLKSLLNKTHNYKLFVYYGNARFEADTGIFNLVNKDSFNVKMDTKPKVTLSDKLLDKTKKRPVKKPETTPKPAETSTPTPEETVKVTKKVSSTKPIPTPVVETTTTVKEVKKSLKVKDTKKKKVVKEDTKAVIIEEVEPTKDANAKVRDILESLNKSATPSVDLVPATTLPVTETQQTGKFFEEVDRMRTINEQRKKTREVKEIIKKSKKKK